MLIQSKGRAEAVAVTDEEAGDCHCAGFEIPSDGRSRYASRMKELHFLRTTLPKRPAVPCRGRTSAKERLFVIPRELCLR